LTVLELTGCKRISNDGLRFIAQGCTQLLKVHVRDCEQITNSGLRSLKTACQNLTDIQPPLNSDKP
jgi:hypothetical protein